MFADSVILDAGLLVAAGFGVLFHVMAARGLGPPAYGAFTASLSYVTLWAVLMEGGTGLSLTREASADPRRLAWASPIASWRIRLVLIGAAGAVAAAWLIQFDVRVIGLVAILVVGMAGLSLMRLAFAVFRAVGQFTWEAALSTLQKALLVVLTAAALALGTAAEGVALAFTLSYVISALPAVRRGWTIVRPALDAPGGVARPPAGFFLRTCVPLLFVELLTGLYFRVDQILLLRLRGPEETGLYAAAFRIVEALLLLVAGVMTVLFPRLAASVRGAADAFRADFTRAWVTLLVSGLIFAVNGWLWGTSLIPVIFGGAYGPTQALLDVLLVAIPVMYVNYLLTQSLVAAGRERFYVVVTGVCTVVNVGVNLLLIPRWGATAAAWATVATEGVLLAGCLIGLRGLGPIIPWPTTLMTSAGITLAAAAGWWALPGRPVTRGLFALALSAIAWELVAPWPLRRLPRLRASRLD